MTQGSQEIDMMASYVTQGSQELDVMAICDKVLKS